MTQTRHAELIDRLRQRERELEAAATHAHEDARAERQPDPPDVGDRAADSYSKEEALRELDQDRRWLASVRDALLREAEGVYGICVHCGEHIQEKRLEAAPWAQYCLKCQELQDRSLS
jgi:DnaK suppressor protein